jgi:hypothetical protein
MRTLSILAILATLAPAAATATPVKSKLTLVSRTKKDGVTRSVYTNARGKELVSTRTAEGDVTVSSGRTTITNFAPKAPPAGERAIKVRSITRVHDPDRTTTEVHWMKAGDVGFRLVPRTKALSKE